MSRRVTATAASLQVETLQKELAALKVAAIKANAEEATTDETNAGFEFDKLAPNEQAAASLGVHPESWKPIGFMNNKHYQQLKAQNVLDCDLARRIEAYRCIASGGVAASATPVH